MKSAALKYIPVNMASTIVSVGTIIILTRLLTAEEFGRYALVITSMNFIHMAFFSWIEAAMARFHEAADLQSKRPNLYKTIYGFALFWLFVVLPVIIILLELLVPEPRVKKLLQVATGCILFQLFYNLNMESHKAAHRIGRYSFFHSLCLLSGFALTIGLIIWSPLREYSPFIGLALASVAFVGLDIPQLFRNLSVGIYDRRLIRQYFIYGAPISFVLVFAYALENGDLYFIKYFLDDESVGAYNAGYSLANRPVDFIFIWLAMAAAPNLISIMEKEGWTATRSVLKDFANLIVVVTLPAAVGMACIAPEAVIILGEPVREKAAHVIPWVSIAAFIGGFVNFYNYQAFVLAKKLHLFATLLIIPVIINFLLNWALIPVMGLKGAYLATLLAFVFAWILTYFFARKLYPMPFPAKLFLKAVIASAVMALVILSLPLPEALSDYWKLTTKIITGALTYAVIIGLLDRQAVSMLRDVFGQQRQADRD